MKNYTITFMPCEQKISVPEGTTIKEAITSSGLDFDFPCGGKGTCGKCRVKVFDNVFEPTKKERKKENI